MAAGMRVGKRAGASDGISTLLVLQAGRDAVGGRGKGKTPAGSLGKGTSRAPVSIVGMAGVFTSDSRCCPAGPARLLSSISV